MRAFGRLSRAAFKPAVDADCLPLKPTWSIKELLAKQKDVEISNQQLAHLHKLSALQLPATDSTEYSKLKADLQQLVKLVEAVRGIKVPSEANGELPDGRIWPEGLGMELDLDWGDSKPSSCRTSSEADLLPLAKETAQGKYYVARRDLPKRRT